MLTTTVNKDDIDNDPAFLSNGNNPAARQFDYFPILIEPGSRLHESKWTFRRSVRYQRKKYGRLVMKSVHPRVKRAIDIVVSLVMLATLSPFFVLAAIAIKLTDGGPILFWQMRVGRWGREFWFPKFRSMVPNADRMLELVLPNNQHKEGVTFKLKDDPRLTWIGRILRKTSFDELPQLWCVLTGRMTLVGPRPAVPREVARYSLADRGRLDVTPGLTCIWQVSGRSNIPFPKQVEMDLDYIDRQSLWLDVKLLFQTVPAVLSGKGAY